MEAVFCPPPHLRYRRQDCPSFGSHVMRVAYEQIVLPVKAWGLDALFSPCVANPVVHPGCRTITTIHDITPFVVHDKYGFLQQTYVRWITRVLALTSDRVITVSENSRTDLTTVLGLQEAKIDVIYNSIRPRDLAHVSYGNYFLCVGALQPAKNIQNTIRAFALFSEKYDDNNHLLLIVGGSGQAVETYRPLIRELNMESRVKLTGYVPDHELESLYAGCTGLIMLSLYEGFGIPPLEALSWNKPSIVSNVSSLPEVVGETGIQVDPLNCEEAAWAMKCIAQAPEKYLRGREDQLSKFSPEPQAEKFLTCLGVRQRHE